MTAVGKERVNAAISLYRDNLEFNATPENSVVVTGESLSVAYTLRNLGGVAISACLGESNGYTFFGPTGVRQRLGPVIDHPGCAIRFSLQPGECLAWTDRVQVLALGPGVTSFSAFLQVVHPRDCDRYGCYDLHIRSAPVPLTISDP